MWRGGTCHCAGVDDGGEHGQWKGQYCRQPATVDVQPGLRRVTGRHFSLLHREKRRSRQGRPHRFHVDSPDSATTCLQRLCNRPCFVKLLASGPARSLKSELFGFPKQALTDQISFQQCQSTQGIHLQ